MIFNKINLKSKKAFTLVELIVSMLILSFIAFYIWRVYFGSSETMRHTVAQSQIQSDIRGFLDQLEVEMITCYGFESVDSDNKSFSFYSFPFGRSKLETIYYDDSGEPIPIGEDSDQKMKILKFEYSWKDGVITKKKTPGYLYFLRKPMLFENSMFGFDESDKASTKEVLKDIDEFEVKGYNQYTYQSADELKVITTPVTPATASSTTFIVLRVHAFKDEGGKKRDEELDIVTKFYSSIRLADAANPGYFCSTDDEGRF